MARSIWKGPFVDGSLLKKISSKKIKTWSRSSTITPELVDSTIEVHNGKKFINILVSEDMIGHKLGEFSPTRKFAVHKKK